MAALLSTGLIRLVSTKTETNGHQTNANDLMFALLVKSIRVLLLFRVQTLVLLTVNVVDPGRLE